MGTTIRSKIIWTFSVLVVLNVAASFWSIYNFYSIGSTLTQILSDNYQSVLAAENMVKSLERQDNVLLVASEWEEPSTAGSSTENVPQLERDSSRAQNEDLFVSQLAFQRDYFNHWFNEATRASTLPAQEPLRDSIQATYQQYSVRSDSMAARIKQGASSEAKQYFYAWVRPKSDRLRELCFQLFEINQAAMEKAVPRTHSIANKTAYVVMIASLIALALSVGAAAWLTRVLITPAENLTARVKQIGAGRVDLKIDVLSDDEIGQLSREFNKMTERLRRFEQLNIDRILAEKRKSEAIVASISDGIIVTDAGMGIVHINTVVASLFGTGTDEAVGMPVAQVVDDERTLTLIREGMSEAAGAGDRPHFLQFEREGRRLYFRPRVTPLRDLTGAVTGVLTILQDVTQFRELDRAKSDFIATLSHEFRTPLTSVTMTVDILNQQILGSLNDRQRELIRSAREDCARLTKLARELLQLSKLEAGRTPLINEELDLSSVVEFSLRPLQIQFGEKGIQLVTELPSGLPHIVADRQQMSWVFTNLVTNALKYTPSGGRVTVSLCAEDDSVRIDVADTGQGIKPEHIERIFDRFVQIKDDDNISTPGSVGLGLAIAKEIVEMYGGRIWAASEYGKGSVFSVRLPVGMAGEQTKQAPGTI
jgi:two-component system, NtrC family, sensor histidine kinase KinB